MYGYVYVEKKTHILIITHMLLVSLLVGEHVGPLFTTIDAPENPCE